MPSMRPTLIDSHVHIELVEKNHPARLDWLKTRGCTVISWAFSVGIGRIGDLVAYWRRQASVVDRLRRQGLDCYFLTGLHPRNIPPDLNPERLPNLLRPYLGHPYCLGLGEIGLETGSGRESDVLRAQLTLADQLAARPVRVGIHTPRNHKAEMTARTLDILSDFPRLRELTVIDHCVPATIGEILRLGYRAGVTLSPVKTGLSDLSRMAVGYADDDGRIMCNSDSGVDFYTDFVEAAQDAPSGMHLPSSLFAESAGRFFNLPGFDTP